MARHQLIKLENRTTFPDRAAAIDYVVQFIGADDFVKCIESDDNSRKSLEELKSLIEKERFHILLDLITGDSNREADLKLLGLLNSKNRGEKAKAITEVVYAIRCNLFHGHKEFAGVQKEILAPVTVIVRRIVACLYNKLSAAA